MYVFLAMSMFICAGIALMMAIEDEACLRAIRVAPIYRRKVHRTSLNTCISEIYFSMSNEILNTGMVKENTVMHSLRPLVPRGVT